MLLASLTAADAPHVNKCHNSNFSNATDTWCECPDLERMVMQQLAERTNYFSHHNDGAPFSMVSTSWSSNKLRNRCSCACLIFSFSAFKRASASFRSVSAALRFCCASNSACSRAISSSFVCERKS